MLKFEDEDWRFVSPGALPPPAVRAMLELVNRVTGQGDQLALRKELAGIVREAEAANDANVERLLRARTMRKIRWSENGGEIMVSSEYNECVINACRNHRMKWDSRSKAWIGKLRHNERDALLERLIKIDEDLRTPAPDQAPESNVA